MTLPVRIASLKRTLAQAILTTERLEAFPNREFTSEEQATLADLESTLEPLVTVEYLHRVVAKQNKLERHKRWQKRRVDNAIKRQKQASKRRQKLNEDLDRWQTETAAQETPRKTPKKKNTLKTQDVNRLITLLQELRDLRRKRLEAKGHFFPQAGDDFYNKIKAQEELGERLVEDVDEEDQDQEDKTQPLYIHPDDNKPYLDQTVYGFWAQGLQTPEALLRIRTQWDMFLDENKGTRIPPTWVAPAPPTNWIWASYLDLNQ